ncbi:hypothetical protein K1T71_002060 [Dendrolimus kikuchii]|uniref:Uncharacterized protein n=1 Tax=Dendrolimus kikuchii TaxID=765133 RepID=A0ACC1DFR8_9NEOP|nr:hypothetical protein K1T71_002060 [Dendrolimus kikuchii]
MELFDLLLQVGLITSALVIYLVLIRKQSVSKGRFKNRGWNYSLKLLYARYAVWRWKTKLSLANVDELPRARQLAGLDSIAFRASAPDGTTILLSIRKLCGRQSYAEVTVHIKLEDGTIYRFQRYPETIYGVWEDETNCWKAGGLKIEVLEPNERMRIIFNGLLTRDDFVTHHVKLNLIWTTATKVIRYPEDWSNKMAAQALASVEWRDDKWTSLLGKRNDRSRIQWGVVQGRFVAYDKEGILLKNVYLRTRGVKERSWAPCGYDGMWWTITINVAARDGTAIMLRAIHYQKDVTEVIYGWVRFPDCRTRSIVSTDFTMCDIYELPDTIPKVYTINVNTESRSLKIVLRMNSDGGRLYSGYPRQHIVAYRSIFAEINGITGSGTLEIGYKSSANVNPTTPISKAPLLKWLSEDEVWDVGYCLSFEDRAAACPNYVGGKGASLALMASVQAEEGYKVPPGFCISTKALEMHLKQNPYLLAAINEIEAANVQYEENNFKAKCIKAAELFNSTEIIGAVKQEILSSLEELRKKSLEQKYGPVLRFTVRSSGVGEDSEALSAAGQNETILGCVSDDDVLLGVQKCWGSMFAFTSSYYRRQNGQPCLCGGGVVVQTLVLPRVAGVMFTRHPEAGDPSRVLITANYGLGESVVSGSVEPDTMIIKRNLNGTLTVQKSFLGSKTQRVIAVGEGVSTENVPDSERIISCLSEEEVLNLARLGVAQEELWGAGRDIEWAISGGEIFLLQARPITSLERWTEEELLHELDHPIMADDELTTFANTGEVMPKPVTPITHDLVIMPLTKGMDTVIGKNGSGYDRSTALFNNRCCLLLFNSVYKQSSPKMDMPTRMIEMAVHGHPVADDAVMATVTHRQQLRWWDGWSVYLLILKSITISGWKVEDCKKRTSQLKLGQNTENPVELLEEIAKAEDLMERQMYNHSVTTSASTASQFVAMSILMEDKSEFTPDLCNEISVLLSSGDVLSAEVPQALAQLANAIDESGQAEEFKRQHPKEAMRWLQDNLTHVYRQVEAFLEDHGHRAIMEFDLSTKPWILAPEDMMKVLQSLKPTDHVAPKHKTDAEVVASLKTPQKNSTRKALSWVIPLCRRTVRHREGTKAHFILAIHKIRLALLKLGDLMVQQWYLPNRDLVFFFRIIELRKYLQTRDPALLKKAIQRQQYYPGWCKLRYAEINTGWVTPLESKGPQVRAGNVRVEATSVCGGETVARACVIKDLSEIDQLQQGDVLITHATDIGWSPYFPLLTGIVTELGGLISHGAVIAREYGLPCIVGATGVTDVFRTGDMVRLSGTKGVLEKVEIEQKQTENS